VLHGRLLGLAVFLRTFVLMVLGGDADAVAPAWVVVKDRGTGETCWRVSAGRGYGTGEHLLNAMEADLSHMTEAAFQMEWRK
jgi:hypothetical protein